MFGDNINVVDPASLWPLKLRQKAATNLPSAVEGRTPDLQADPDKSPDQADFYASGQSSDKNIFEETVNVKEGCWFRYIPDGNRNKYSNWLEVTSDSSGEGSLHPDAGGKGHPDSPIFSGTNIVPRIIGETVAPEKVTSPEEAAAAVDFLKQEPQRKRLEW